MKNIAFLYSLIIMLSLAFGSCSRKYGCYYSNYESMEIPNKDHEIENPYPDTDLNSKGNDCVQTCN